LLEEFTIFLPDNSLAPSTQHAPFGHRDLNVERPDLDDNRTMNMSSGSPDKKKSVKKAEANGLSSGFASHDGKDALKSKLSYYALVEYVAWTCDLYLLHFRFLLLF